VGQDWPTATVLAYFTPTEPAPVTLPTSALMLIDDI